MVLLAIFVDHAVVFRSCDLSCLNILLVSLLDGSFALKSMHDIHASYDTISYPHPPNTFFVTMAYILYASPDLYGTYCAGRYHIRYIFFVVLTLFVHLHPPPNQHLLLAPFALYNLPPLRFLFLSVFC